MTKAIDKAARALCEHEAAGTCIEGLSERIFASEVAGDKRIVERFRKKARVVLSAVLPTLTRYGVGIDWCAPELEQADEGPYVRHDDLESILSDEGM